MSKIILKWGFSLSICVVLVLISSMSLDSNNYQKRNNIWTQDSLTAKDNYKIDLLKEETIEFNITDSPFDDGYNLDAIAAKGTKPIINSDEYSFNFNHYELIKDEKLECPEELNLFNPKSNSTFLKSLMNFTFAKYNLLGGYSLMSWLDYYYIPRDGIEQIDDLDNGWRHANNALQFGAQPNQKEKWIDANGEGIDDKMMGIFHDLMKNKFAREIIYESIKQNYKLINNQITEVQKKILLLDVNSLIRFCENYSSKRKEYLKGRNSLNEKIGDFTAIHNYGLNTLSTEGFFFRRIEYDAVPPSELVSFLKTLKAEIISSITASDFDSNMSTVVNSSELKINSYINSKNKMGFLLRTINNSVFIESNSMKLTKLVIKGKIYWRVLYNDDNDFINLDEGLNKI